MPQKLSVVGLTDVGRTRTRNEDSLSLLPEVGVAVVADGMGGHPGGDVASRIAAGTAAGALAELVAAGPAPGGAAAGRLSEGMHRCVLRAHEEIRAEGERTPELSGMGTTLTALLVDAAAGLYVLGHVGDSRAYRYRGERLTCLTRDDTWIQDRIDANELTPEEGRRHPYAHLLTQCLGLDETPRPQVMHGEIRTGDAFLLCTDGLVGMLDDPELEAILAGKLWRNGAARGSESTLRALLEAANDAGGHDNITAVLVTLAPPDEP